MENKDIVKVHEDFDNVVGSSAPVKQTQNNFSYEVLASVEVGYVECNILEVDTETQLAKVEFYHPYGAGWRENCSGGIYEEVVEMWRVRLRED
jgi:hypothetical protein